MVPWPNTHAQLVNSCVPWLLSEHAYWWWHDSIRHLLATFPWKKCWQNDAPGNDQSYLYGMTLSGYSFRFAYHCTVVLPSVRKTRFLLISGDLSLHLITVLMTFMTHPASAPHGNRKLIPNNISPQRRRLSYGLNRVCATGSRVTR